jgi:hypothetical protein
MANSRIRWGYAFEKAIATLGSIGLMIVISEQYVLPAITPILPPKTIGMTLPQKLTELGWVLLDMILPYAPYLSYVLLPPCRSFLSLNGGLWFDIMRLLII